MVQKAAGSSRRGRPPKFDRDAVVAGAIEAFFTKGYEATTLTDLETATGVDRSTLYNSFDGKRGLYSMATTEYLTRAETGLFEPLYREDGDGYDDVLRFLERLRAGVSSGDLPPGCLIVNDMATGPDPEASRRYVVLLETGLRQALRRAPDADLVGVDATHDRARLLAASVVGINLVAKTTEDRSSVGPLVDAAIREVKTWQRPS